MHINWFMLVIIVCVSIGFGAYVCDPTVVTP